MKDVEHLIDADHPARATWELVGRLDLQMFYDAIESEEGEAGRSAFDPRMLISVWVYAYSRGVGSAREVSRLCESDPVLCQNSIHCQRYKRAVALVHNSDRGRELAWPPTPIIRSFRYQASRAPSWC